MYYVYILMSRKDNIFYTGSTKDLVERLKRHNSGLVSSTKFRIPFELIYYESCLNRKDAIRRELYLKTSWGKRYINSRLKFYLSERRSQLDSLRHPTGFREVPKGLLHLEGGE